MKARNFVKYVKIIVKTIDNLKNCSDFRQIFGFVPVSLYDPDFETVCILKFS